MKWYDFFSNFYDRSLEKLYAESRRKATEFLDLRDGKTVLDVACGTGANFKHIKKKNANVVLYGTDFSEGMLKKAQAGIEKYKWENINLFQSDVRDLNPGFIEKTTHHKITFDRIICVLGLSVTPDWDKVLDN